MNKLGTFGKFAGIYAAAGAVVIGIFVFCYKKFELFRALFEGRTVQELPASGDLPPQTAEALAKQVEVMAERTAALSFWLLVFVLLIQIFAFITALLVYRGIRLSEASLNVKKQQLENADLFLDLPLYFGLFGTVSSFIVMSFNPQISRLIAYSSTLVGIIISVLLRLCLQYPMKQKLLNEQEKTQDCRRAGE